MKTYIHIYLYMSVCIYIHTHIHIETYTKRTTVLFTASRRWESRMPCEYSIWKFTEANRRQISNPGKTEGLPAAT